MYPEYLSAVKTFNPRKLDLNPNIAFFLYNDPLPFDPTPIGFLNSFNFTHSASGRHISYYGTHSYEYGTFTHDPLDFSTNPYLCELSSIIRTLFPLLNFNSALINYYPKADSCISFHSDDESEIKDDSYILTFSFGDTRRLEFLQRSPPKNLICNVSLPHRSLLIFSKTSQFVFRHGILPKGWFKIDEFSDFGRLSVTFRHIVQPSDRLASPRVLN